MYTVRPCFIHTSHAVPLPCHDHAVLKVTSHCYARFAAGERHGMCELASENGRVGAGERHGMCELASENGRVGAGERHGMCESALIPLLFESV
jgi:hypothetical protein